MKIKIIIAILFSPILIPLIYIATEPWIKWHYVQYDCKISYNKITGIVKSYWLENDEWKITNKTRQYGYSGLCNYGARYI